MNSTTTLRRLSPLALLLALALAALPAAAQDMVITGVIDGPLSGGVPKAVELCVLNDIPDLTLYGLGSANNGGGSDGEEFTFPAGAASAGSFLYVASEATGFQSFFGFAPDHTSGALAINGDDAIELFTSGAVSDVFGDINVDGSGEPWDHLDGWAYRNNGTGPDGSTFVLANWFFSGINALDGETSNGSATTPFPLGTYSGCSPAVPVPDLLLSEIVVTPTGGEYIEIFNPGAAAVDLSDVYLTDATFAGGGVFYYNIVTGADAGGGGFGDFHARFPDGASIAAGEFQTIALAGSDDFVSEYAASPTYELYEDGAADGVPDMREALPGAINNQGGLSNSGEVVVLYTWDGASDLVADIDYAVWGDKAEAVDKTGVVIDGPDADSSGSAYFADTAISDQDVVAPGSHAGGSSFQRIDFAEGAEAQAGGNGVTGSDETSEDLSNTWAQDAPTPGAGPPPPPASGWIVNEINADPASGAAGDANGDGSQNFSEDEFLEIVNATGGAVDISGWTVADGFTVRHTFPAGTVIPDQCGVVIFGGGTPTGEFGNMTVQTASTGSLGLNNGGDSVTLNDGVSDQAVATYGSEGGDNQSLTLDPDLTGTPPYAKHSTATGSGGALFSPGTSIDGSFFGGCPPPPAPWVINEIHADPASGAAGDANGDGSRDFSDDEFVEIVNNTGADVDVSGWTVADGFSVRHVFPPGSVIRDGCAAVVFGGGSPTGAFGNTLVQTASDGALGLNNGGDAITLNDGVSDVAMVTYGGEAGDNQSVTLDPDVTGALPYVKHTLATGAAGALFSPGTRIDGSGFAGCPVTAEIYEIQGSGAASPLADALVISNDNVVTALAPDGFFMQTPAARSDGDVDTSDGIFVFTGAAPTVAVGDQVDVIGQVVEFFGFTEFALGTAVTVDGPGTLPPAVVFDGATPSPDPLAPSCALEFECYEGMLVSIAAGAVSGPNQRFNVDPIAEVHIVADATRAFREPGVAFPGLGLPPIPTWDGNPEVFELDPDKLGLPNQIIPAGSTFSAVGVLGFEFGGYEFWPSQLTVNAAPLPVPVRPRATLEFTVGSLNMFRFFDDMDDPPSANANGDVVRDDFVDTNYLQRRDKFVSHILDVLDAPDILAVQEVEKIEVLQALAADIALVEPGVVYTAYLIEGNDVGTIDVGFLTRDTIAVDAVTQFGYTTIFDFDGSLLHDRPPLLLEARCIADGADIPVSVLVLHNRSLGGIDSPTSGERVRQKRLAQAQFVAQLAQDAQTADPDVPLVIVGDYNAFEFTDGYVDVVGQIAGDADPAMNLVSGPDLVDPNLTKQVLSIAAGERYSFIFGGSAQVLDHALTTVGLDPRVTGFEYGRGNADAALDLINDATTPGNLALRSSDHDGFVLYLTKDLDGDGVVDNLDVCADTVIPEGVPTQGLGVNRWALVDGDTVFDTSSPPGGGGGPGLSFTTEETAGCSCEQIIDALNLGQGHVKFGCSNGAMQTWVDLVNP